MDKKYAEKIHFKNRVQERLGITINRVDIMKLVTDINKEDNVFKSYSLSKRKVVYDMMFMKKRCFIFFDRHRNTPITVYTKEMGIDNVLKKLEGDDD